VDCTRQGNTAKSHCAVHSCQAVPWLSAYSRSTFWHPANPLPCLPVCLSVCLAAEGEEEDSEEDGNPPRRITIEDITVSSPAAPSCAGLLHAIAHLLLGERLSVCA
jgi:hypothetical protein